MPKVKVEEQHTTLRRSSRSTRGSIKPVVDLTKSELSDNQEDDNEQTEDKNEDDDDVQIYNPSDDEDFKEPTSRAKKQTKAVGSTKKTKQQPATVRDEKKPKKATKQVKTESKAKGAKVASKSTANNEVVEREDQDEVKIYYQLSEKEMKEVNDAFSINCSQDAEELLSSEDLKTAIRSLGFEPRADEISKLMKRFSNKSGKVNRENFHKIMAFKIGTGNNDESTNDEISKVFNLLDLDKTGMITFENLKSISKELNEEITDEELNEMIVEADLDGDFQINKQEFYHIMKKTSLY